MKPRLEVCDLEVTFLGESPPVHAVRGVTFALATGQRLALVGESGSGKSVSALAILGLLPVRSVSIRGSILLAGERLDQASERRRRALRGRHLALMFQDPLTSLNPYLSVGDQILETVHLRGLRGAPARNDVVERLTEVGLDDPIRIALSPPHRLSGGQRQRAALALALAGEPDVLIADEPTTALDVGSKRHVLELLRATCARRGLALLIVSHDLGVVSTVATDVAVLYAGRIVERGTVDRILSSPAHPYTRALLAAIPRWDGASRQPLAAIDGTPPDPRHVPSGCPFAPRCPLAIASCASHRPELEPRDSDHWVACPISGHEEA